MGIHNIFKYIFPKIYNYKGINYLIKFEEKSEKKYN